MSYESKVPTVAFLKCVKVHHIKLADIEQSSTVGVRLSLSGGWRSERAPGGVVELRREEVLPAPLEDAHTWAVIPTCVPHPAQAGWVAFDDNVHCGLGILEILVDLYNGRRLREGLRGGSRGVDTHHPDPESDV